MSRSVASAQADMKLGDHVRARPGSAAADVAGDGSPTGVVQAVDTTPADGVAYVLVLMDDGLHVQTPEADWTAAAAC